MAGMAIRGVAVRSGNGAEYQWDLPAEYVAGDVVYRIVVHNGGISHAIQPGGWATEKSFLGLSAGTVRVYRLSGPTQASWTATLASASPWVTACIAVKPDDDTSKAPPTLDVILAADSASSATAVLTPAITPTAADDLTLFMALWRGTTFSAPSGVTEIVDARSGDSAGDKALWIGSLAVAGGAGVEIAAKTVAVDNPFGLGAAIGAGVAFAIKAAVPPTSWAADHETGDLSQWPLVQFVSPQDTMTAVNDGTARSGSYHARLVTHETGIAVESPPRTQLGSPFMFRPATTRWLSWSTRFGADVPDDLLRLMFFQIYGPPYGFSGPTGFRVTNDWIAFRPLGHPDNAFPTPPLGVAWRMPLIREEWLDFAVRIRLEQSLSGWIELWVRRESDNIARRQFFANRKRRLYYQSIDGNIGTGFWAMYLNNYRTTGTVQTTVDHDNARIDVTPPSWIPVGLAPAARR